MKEYTRRKLGRKPVAMKEVTSELRQRSQG